MCSAGDSSKPRIIPLWIIRQIFANSSLSYDDLLVAGEVKVVVAIVDLSGRKVAGRYDLIVSSK